MVIRPVTAPRCWISVLVATAVLLLAVGGTGFAVSRRPLAAAGTLIAAVLVASGLPPARAARSNVVYFGSSFHGELKVVDVRDGRLLLIDGLDNGFVDRVTMTLPTLLSAVYFFFIAADQYESESRFVVRSAARPAPGPLQHRGVDVDRLLT